MPISLERGYIEPAALYTREEMQRRLQLSDAGWRELRERGLSTARIGKKPCLLGSSLVEVAKREFTSKVRAEPKPRERGDALAAAFERLGPTTIKAGAIYTLVNFKRRMLLSDADWLQIRKDGMPSVKIGGKAFVVGSHAIEFSNRPMKEAAPPAAEHATRPRRKRRQAAS